MQVLNEVPRVWRSDKCKCQTRRHPFGVPPNAKRARVRGPNGATNGVPNAETNAETNAGTNPATESTQVRWCLITQTVHACTVDRTRPRRARPNESRNDVANGANEEANGRANDGASGANGVANGRPNVVAHAPHTPLALPSHTSLARAARRRRAHRNGGRMEARLHAKYRC